MNKKQRILSVFLLSLVLLCCSCTAKDKADKAKLDTSKEVHLVVAGAWTDCVALEEVIRPFEEKYPNAHVEYEFIQDYTNMLGKRLAEDSDKIDLFFTMKLQSDAEAYPYAVDLFAHPDSLDLSNTFDGLIQNFSTQPEDQTAAKQLLSIPLGGEMRGLYVNKTLLASVGLEVPKNRAEFLKVCEVLAENGYMPLQGNPGTFAHQFLYPYVANIIANADDVQKTYNQINNCEAGSSELFREPLSLLYNIVKDGYYNYKLIETEYNRFTDSSFEWSARYFLNLVEDGDMFKKVDDLGVVPFMNGSLSQGGVLAKAKSDYHSEIEYEFILAPLSETEGGYAYLSPAHGIAINNNSDNLDYALEFLNILFSKEVNENFSKVFDIIPNNKDAFEYITKNYAAPENQISELGQVTFDYDFYKLVTGVITDIAKANNPKYMQEDGTMYDFEHYMSSLEDKFTEQREQIAAK